MSILKSNSVSIDQQPIDPKWLSKSGINRFVPTSRSHISFESIYKAFRIYEYINKDGSIELKTSFTHFLGNEFYSERLRTRGDVLRFLNTINSLIGDQS